MSIGKYFEVIKNNEDVVILVIKRGIKKIDLIEHPFFNGTEEFIRITKGARTEVTVFTKDDKCFAWHFGTNSCTVVNQTTKEFGYELLDFVRFELGVYMGYDKVKIKNNLAELESGKKSRRNLKVTHGNGSYQFTLHIDNEFAKTFPNKEEFECFIQEHFIDESERTTSLAETGVNVIEFTAIHNI